jgi:hypothetical protein
MSAKHQRKQVLTARSREQRLTRKNKADDQKGEIDDQDMGWKTGKGYWCPVRTWCGQRWGRVWVEPSRQTLTELAEPVESDTCYCGR